MRSSKDPKDQRSLASIAPKEVCTVTARPTLHQSLDLFDYQEGVTCRHYALFVTPRKLHRSASESNLLINEEEEKSDRRWLY